MSEEVGSGRRVIRRGEVISFAATTFIMLVSITFFPSFYWLFILLAFVDGVGTSLGSVRLLTVDRLFFALLVILLGAMAFGLDVLAMILETALLIVILDLLFLVRRMWTPSDFSSIVLQRFRSYLYTLFPAVIFGTGLVYLGSETIGATVGPANAILELGIASVAVFLIILLASRSAGTPK